MIRFVACALVLLCIAHAAEPRAPRITHEEIPIAAAAGAIGASATRAADGTVWMSWVEPAGSGTNALSFSIFDAVAKKWTAPRVIARDKTVPTNSLDFPQLAINARGRATALWADGKGGAYLTHAENRGATWTTPEPVTDPDGGIEMISLVALPDGPLLAAWIAGTNPKHLDSRIVGKPSHNLRGMRQVFPSGFADALVCECCPPALTAFPDGSALLAYRGRTPEDVRDIHIVRLTATSTDAPRVLNNDDWRLNACPMKGPRLASDGGRVAAAWFTGADNDPRVLASFSPDAGARFLLPLRIDRGRAAGPVDVALLHDGAFLVTWVENDGSLWLRRITPDFTADEPTPLAPPGSLSTQTFPRLALVRDYLGGTVPAQLLAAFATNNGLRTLLVTVPEAELLEAEKNCDCAPSPEELRGFPIRGTIMKTLDGRENKTVQVAHHGVPGIFREGTRDFKVAPEIAGQLPLGRQFLGRVERRDGDWWLFDVRLLAMPKP